MGGSQDWQKLAWERRLVLGRWLNPILLFNVIFLGPCVCSVPMQIWFSCERQIRASKDMKTATHSTRPKCSATPRVNSTFMIVVALVILYMI